MKYENHGETIRDTAQQAQRNDAVLAILISNQASEIQQRAAAYKTNQKPHPYQDSKARVGRAQQITHVTCCCRMGKQTL